MIIDVHSHYYSPAIADALGRHGAIRPYACHPPLAERLEALTSARVDRQILSMGALMPYLPDKAKAAASAREINDLHREAIEEHPGRFGAFGVLPLPHVGPSIEEIAHCLDALRFEGIALGSGADGSPVDDDRFEGIWQELNRRAAIVYLHPGVNNKCPLCNGVQYSPFILDSSFGSPAEMGRCVVRLVLSGIVERFPRIRFVVANFGGLLTNAWPHVLHGVKLSGLPDIVGPIRKMWFDTGTLTMAQLVAISASYGTDRLVLGSDAPYGKLVDTVQLIRSSPQLSSAEAEQILNRAAVEVFT